MSTFDHFQSWGLSDPATLQGAVLFAIVFAFSAWLVGRLLRLAVLRAIAHDKHDHFDLMSVRFVAKLVRYCVYVFAFISYTHIVPALTASTH